jgi:phosphatidylserine decarboxylase
VVRDNLKLLLQYLLPKRWLTVFAGVMGHVRHVAIKNFLISSFIKRYGVNMHEAVDETVDAYADFNAFFIRRLKPGCRRLAHALVVSPVDGYVSEMGHLESGRLLQAKHRWYRLDDLLTSSSTECADFYAGRFATLYLSPKDYHRVHMPIAGVLERMVYVPGTLFSVQPATTRTVAGLFARNERLVIFFQTELGPMVIILVGAVVVGSMATTWHGVIPRGSQRWERDYRDDDISTRSFKQFDEVGWFNLGSTVIVLFSNQALLEWDSHWHSGLPVRVGESLVPFPIKHNQ